MNTDTVSMADFGRDSGPDKLLTRYSYLFSDDLTDYSILEDVPDAEKEESMRNAVVIFFHCEAEDEGKYDGVVQKFVKNTKWLAGKFNVRNVVLHSFNHLSTSKSSAEFAGSLLEEVRLRLEGAGYKVMQTPFGYFNEFRMHVAGDSLAKVFKEF